MAYTILIVDDQESNCKLMASIVKQNTNYDVNIATSAFDVLEMFQQPEYYSPPDIILLDILMPGMDGFELAGKLKEIPAAKNIPIIYVTALSERENIAKAFHQGGVDYITKPYQKEELLVRLEMHLELAEKRRVMKDINCLLVSKKELLANLVDQKTMIIENLTLSLVNALENANLLNDNDTGHHIKRVSAYSGILAKAYGCDDEYVNKIKLFASLHDVGKVGIPDMLLKKPGQYTAEEFEQMKEHVRFAEKMLGGEGVDEIAMNIAVYHHEKWDGTGYVHQLKGEQIPLEARIVAVADVFDALSFGRIYKKALSIAEALKIIREESGAHFDPAIVDAFFSAQAEILSLKGC